ncbi:MAG: hypothetical protein KHZ51_03580 [Streptococcus mitis]|uniref:Uncharacterized protein n=1 Tax=Streptococcus mitis TaxID=28037 RepID=A0A943AG97_STRMT|nr:hypothetical protein [Streptococcus mitis]
MPAKSPHSKSHRYPSLAVSYLTPFLLDFSFLREKYYYLTFCLPVNYITSKKRVKKKREN